MTDAEKVVKKQESTYLRNYRFSMVMTSFSSISLISFIIFSSLFYLIKLWPLLILSIFCSLIWLIIFIISRKGYNRVAFVAGILISVFFSLVCTLVVGWNSGFFFSTLLIIPLVFLNAKMNKIFKVILGLIVGGILIFVYINSISFFAFVALQDFEMKWFYGINLFLAVVTLSFIGHFFETAAIDAEKSLVLANKKLTSLATTDPVTNLVNRRTMMIRIEQEKERLERNGKPFVLIMIDIDNFKQVNDDFGHDAGDFALVGLADLINVSLRKQDEVARWGGDEFLILLPETELEGGRIVAEKIRSRILRTPFVYRHMDIPVTVTLGVGLCDTNIGIGSCIRKADQALYVGKQAGKNRVTLG